MLALADGDGGCYVHHAEGPFAVALRRASTRAELGRDRGWVEPGTSMLHDRRLRRQAASPATSRCASAGAGALIVLPLAAGAASASACSLLADRATSCCRPSSIELLELLGHPDRRRGCGWPAALVALRERAARDPLTGPRPPRRLPRRAAGARRARAAAAHRRC